MGQATKGRLNDHAGGVAHLEDAFTDGAAVWFRVLAHVHLSDFQPSAGPACKRAPDRRGTL